LGVFPPVLPALAGELAHFAHSFGQFDLVRNEYGKALLDREARVTGVAHELLLVSGEGRLALGVDRAAELCEESVVHEGSVGSGSGEGRKGR
jgi:hypothetical protein